ncbi:MAG TPA: efflux RND transporter periplasmic adaptor subunit [Burkholderiales bacterium]|nr:efflux RND transporter periplasmic adaptor subunit [Burkholderiales bacterium]
MKAVWILVGATAVAAVAGYGGYRIAHQRMAEAPAQASAGAAPQAGGVVQDQSGKQVLYWFDPMYPQQKFDKPGKSPFMDMQLVPKHAGEGGEAGSVSISPQVVQNLGVRTAQAKTGSLEQRMEAVGSVAYNERGVVQLQARASGFVERLHARAPLDPVRKGAPLVEILYPDWAAAQQEYLLLRKTAAQEMPALTQAARQRLLLLGMSEAEIAAVDREGATRARITLYSPVSGVIAELGVREGMTVMPGAPLFKIVDLSTVWVNAEVPEAQAAWLLPGSPVTARVAAYPEATFEGKVGAILPEVTAATRTLRSRIELKNPESRLKPGMFATLVFHGERGKDSVLVPSEAVIRTGSRDVVVLALGEGKFRAVPVEVGSETAGQSEIRKGLQAGDNVVLSGQFLIDSEASLGATISRLEVATEQPQASAGQTGSHKSRGRVKEVDAAAGRVELEHEPIPAMQWPAMTMGFIAEDKAQLMGLKKGDVVEFEVKPKPDQEGNYLVPKIAKAGGK